jgi:hypothetical protein
LFFVHLLSQSLLQEFLERQTLLGCDRTDFGAVSMAKCGATWKFRASFLLESAWGLDGFVAYDAWLSMLPGGYPAAQDFAGVRLGAAEGGFVNFAIRILRQHRAECAKSVFKKSHA